jgi:DNA-directed RNA polymerase subunit RPC12/RpoP
VHVRARNLHQCEQSVLDRNRTADANTMTPQLAVRRPPLRLVSSDALASVLFCGHCGERFDDDENEPVARVCPSCSLGVLLHTREDLAPRPHDAFLIVDSSLSVQAMSERAETALGISESYAVNRHITELLIPGDSEASAAGSLAVAITHAAAGDDLGTRIAVRPSNTFGVRMLARIAACGPPRAALLVLS